MVFERLLPEGPMMYGRKSDANCILRVGQRRYFVHVQILCSRSSTFNRIINEMMVNQAWGPDGFSCFNDDDYKDDAEDGDDGDGEGNDVLDLEYSHPAAHDGHIPSSGVAVGMGGGTSNAHASTSIATIATATTTFTSASTSMSTTPIAPSSIIELNSNNNNNNNNDHGTDEDLDSSMMDEDEDHAHVFDMEDVLEHDVQDEEEEGEEDDAEDDDDDDEDNENHPTLTLKLSRPVSSRFDEMLYWIYTDQSDRWRRSFTPENYRSILHNIALLHLVNPTVLEICRSFEADHQAFQGTAEEFFISRRLL
ncbi:hypothetical protein BGZ95_009596 [Linnemannia exigua]|uniref:BTB domain-containing protein n=1 Tax=Linnemannia exigua TaxID=604196 RepID=A0AAD4DCK3_9FUNG|nr:hypothetical protein BGZ95_009596 [Linnemannia exigua]